MPTTYVFNGAAHPVAQVEEITVGGVTAGAKWDITLNNAVASYTAITGDDTTTVIAGLIAAITEEAREFQLVTAEAHPTDTTKMLLTSATPGVPFGTISTAVSGGGTVADASITAASGPNFWADENFLPVAAPISGDTIIFENSTVSLLFDIDQNLLAGMILEFHPTWSGTIGLPELNPLGFPEFRDQKLKMGVASILADTPSTRMRIDCNGETPTIHVRGTGAANDESQALSISNFTNGVFRVDGGGLSLCGYAGESGTASKLEVSSDATVEVSDGVTSLVTVNVDGSAVVTTEASFTSLTITGGAVTVWGAATGGTIVNEGGTIEWNSSGAITTYTTDSDAAVLDASMLIGQPLTITTLNGYAGQLTDPHGRLAVTNLLVTKSITFSQS